MSFQHHGADAVCYAPCYYNDIKMAFRGPKRDLDGPFIACLGGAGMFGKYVPRALPDVVEAGSAMPAVNLGQVNGGVDFMVSPEMLSVASRATVTVIDLVGAHNLSNRFYRVHPRRNDRVIAATPLMKRVFPELDLSDVHFTRHLLTLMQAVAPARTETVIEDLRQEWLERMHALVRALPGPVILLWMGGGPVPQKAEDATVRIPFVDEQMVSGLSGTAADLVVIDGHDLRKDRTGMVFPDDALAQLEALPTAHEVAFAGERVLHALARHLPKDDAVPRARRRRR
ncbi:DUF6473 family protein [Tropicimonas sp. S265A]|uniref:DUF6473 family protein n=1 Tax=Tropicimonas sp. S265A TaxID=3415134 RepID=UPI003C7DEC26